MEEEYTLDCPYCGEPTDLLLDLSSGSQEYVEDCQVCCQPILLQVEVDYDGQLVAVTGKTNDEG